MNAALTLAGLVAGHDAVPTVHGLDLTVHAGEIVALLGPNGAGKTTTLLTITGLLPVIAGEITVLGQPPRRRRPDQIARLGVALVPEQRGVFAGLTAEQNLRLRGRSIDPVVDQFPPLRRIMKRRAGLLSGGEQQMLALACALATNPRLLMIDEMSHGLAPVVVEELLPTLRSTVDQTRMAVLLVEQHVHTALDIADRACVLNRGQVMLHGPAGELRDRLEEVEASYLTRAGTTPA